jgi:outer membrane lipoprotein-sorting protein
MTCRQAQKHLVDLLDSQPPDGASELSSHLAACASCAREYAAIQVAIGRIQPRLRVQASPDFKERVMNEIMQTETKRSRWRLVPRLAFAGAAAIVAVLLFAQHGQSPAVSLLAQSAQAMSNVQSVHISARMRTRPAENFEYINADCDWVPLEIWKQFSDPPKWRVEKPGRVVVMDGTSSLLLIKPNGAARGGPRTGFVEWLKALLDTEQVLEKELAAARAQQATARVAEEKHNGARQLVLAVKRAAQGDFTNDWLLNKTVSDSNHTRIYRFDPDTKRLEGMQLVLHAKTGDVAVFEITAIRYNEAFDPALFTLALPDNVIWSVAPEQMPAAQPLPQSAKEAAVTLFGGFAREDWEQVLLVFPASAVDPRLQKAFGGLQVISIGEPFQSGLYRGWFVPYEIRLKSGAIKKHNLALRNDNPAHRWVWDGGL